MDSNRPHINGIQNNLKILDLLIQNSVIPCSQKEKGPILLLVYVYVIIIAGPSNSIIDSIKKFLHTQFNLRDLRDLKFFLGLKTIKLEDGILLTQSHYTLKLLYDMRFIACKPINYPMDTKK